MLFNILNFCVVVGRGNNGKLCYQSCRWTHCYQSIGLLASTLLVFILHYSVCQTILKRYVAILNCDNSKVKTYYKLTFINTDGSQFSFDESGKPINFALVNFPGLLPMSAVFFTTYALLIGASCFADYFYWRKRAFHAVCFCSFTSLLVQLLQAIGICLIVMFFAFMFSMSHWASYANNGIGCPACNDIGESIHYSHVFF